MKNPTCESDVGFGDEMLMDELVRQEAHALEELYGRYRPILRGVIMRILNDELDAEDVLQEVFLQIWTRAESYSPAKGKPLGWLITLARRRAIDRLRQRCAYRRATDRFELESQDPTGALHRSPTADVAVFQEDVRDLLRVALGRLPQKQHDVVSCAYLAGMSQREIAAHMNIPLGTVKTRMELGLRKLASVLAGARRKVF
jgi:RNA polymerase sigma-70 factor (ECF subfamily)